MMITTPFTSVETAAQRHTRLRTIHDWYFGAGSYDAAGTLGGAFTQLNSLMPVPVVNGETFASWAPKLNFLNNPDLALPFQIFEGGTKGAMFDLANTTSLFQDSAGATPVTAAGQPIGRIADQSGGGYHALQAISTARSTYRIDGGGRPYAETDGVDDYMATSAIPLGSSGRTLIVGMRKRSDASLGLLAETGANWSLSAGGVAIFAPHIAGTASYGSRSMPASTQSTLTSGNTFAAPHTAVLTAKSADASHILRVNGQQVASGAPAGPMSALTAVLNLFARNGNQSFLGCDFYCLTFADRVLTPIEEMRVEKWTALKCGVTL